MDAVISNFHVIGEAADQLPEDVKEKYDEIKWRDVKDFRNVLIYKYWEIDRDIIWEIIEDELPELKQDLEKITDRESEQEEKPESS